MKKFIAWSITLIAALPLLFACGGGGGGGAGSSEQEIMDNIAPSVSSTSPGNNSSDVSTDLSVTVTFSEPVREASVNDSSILVIDLADNSSVAGTVSCSGSIITFTPSQPLAFSSSYRVTVKAGVKDLAGNATLADHVINFDTGVDTSPFEVTSTDPINAATGVLVTKDLTVAFSKSINCSTVDETTFLLDGVAGTVTCTNSVATFSPLTNLDYSTGYTATLKGSVADPHGNTLGSDHTWSFTTTSGNGAPYVTELSPENGPGAVCLNDFFLIKFSELIDHSTLVPQSSIVMSSPTGVIDGYLDITDYTSLSYPSSTWVSYYSNSDLERNTDYALTITTDVSDRSGNPMESSFVANFKSTWATVLGTLQDDIAYDIDIGPDDSVVIAGSTKDNLVPDAGNNYSEDVFVAKYASNGSLQWVDQRGGINGFSDKAMDVTVDSSGNVYVVGYASTDIDDQTNNGSADVLLIKYSEDGTRLWTILDGTSDAESARGVVVNNSGIVVVGSTSGPLGGETNEGMGDAFIVQYDSQGASQWYFLLGTTDSDYAEDVAVDGNNNLFVAGTTRGGIDGHTNQLDGLQDYFLAKFDASGTLMWSAQDGTTANDWANGVAVTSSGDPVIVGATKGEYVAGAANGGTSNSDFFLAMYDGATGELKWKQQFGAINVDAEAYDVVIDDSDNIYLVGTSPKLNGDVGSGGSEFFVAKYDSTGVLQWSRLSWASGGIARGVALDSNQRIYLGGEIHYKPYPSHYCGVPLIGQTDAIIVPFDTEGNRL